MTTKPDAPHIGPRAAIWIFFLAFAVRLAAIGAVGFETLRFGDARAYMFAAKELVRTGHYPRETEPFYFRAPGYPVFLALVTLGRPDRVATAKIANAVAGSLAVLLLASLSARIFRRRTIALATGVAAAVHPGLTSLSVDIESESLFLLLLLTSGFLLLAASDRPSSNLAIGAGFLAALAALTRPSGLLLGPFLAAPLFDRRYPLRARAHLAASALLGFVLALAPWALRNALVFHELLPVNDAAGSAFYQGNSDWAVRFYRLRSRSEYLQWSREAFSDLARQTRELERSGLTSPSARSRYFFRKAVEERSGDPAGWAWLILRKAWHFARPYPDPLFWPRSVVFAVGLVGTAVTGLALVGFAAGAGRPGVRAFALAFLGATFAAHVILIVVWRYRIPYWDPVLLLYAIPGAARLKGSLSSDRVEPGRPAKRFG